MAIFNKNYTKFLLEETNEGDKLKRRLSTYQKSIKGINNQIKELEDREFKPEENSRNIRKNIETLKKRKDTLYNKADKTAGELEKINNNNIFKNYEKSL